MKLNILLISLIISTNSISQIKYKKDFLEFWNDVNENHAYLHQQKINWDKVKEIYQPIVDTIQNKIEFIKLLEAMINELHNGHISLNVNLSSSNKIIPSGSDIFVRKIENKYFITDIRKNSASELCGLKPDMQVVKFNGSRIDKLLHEMLPKYAETYTKDMIIYALNMIFAGTHDKERVITISENGVEKNYFPDKYKKDNQSKQLLEYKEINKKTGYVKINNSLGNYALIQAFDDAIDSLHQTERLIIDLTETPGGGNTTVARAIMGRFIDKELPYQRHEFFETRYKIKRSWIEYVSPRQKTYKGKLFVLVGRWTGSMGEGIAIGFDGMKRAKIIGTEMAGLLGAIESFYLSETKISFQIPTERLYHINGTPREQYIPEYQTENINETWKIINEIIKK